MDSRMPLQTNFQNGGMKKVLKEEIAAKRSYAIIAGIPMGESSGVKVSFCAGSARKPRDN